MLLIKISAHIKVNMHYVCNHHKIYPKEYFEVRVDYLVCVMLSNYTNQFKRLDLIQSQRFISSSHFCNVKEIYTSVVFPRAYTRKKKKKKERKLT